MYSTERRRVVIASIVTVVAVPALWIMNRDPDNNAAVGADGAVATAPPVTAYEPPPPVFVGGGDEQPVSQGVINIAVAPGPATNSLVGKASFRRYPDTLDRPCTVPRAPDTATITVVNIDNGQFLTCTNILTIQPPAGVDIVIHTDVFAEIGDVSDSPIDVRVSW